MKRFKNQVKKDLMDKTHIPFTFDKNLLPSNTEKKVHYKRMIRNTCIIMVSCLLLTIVSIPLFAFMNVESSYRKIKKDYSIHQLNLIESSSFKKLNEVNYPDIHQQYNLTLSSEYKESMVDFAYQVYQNTEQIDNFSFTPVGLYSNLFVASLASQNDEVLKDFDNVLGLSFQERKENFVKMYQKDYFSNSNGTLQMYNSVFLTNQYSINNDFLHSLSDCFVEAYQLNFSSNKDVNQMLSWVDQKLNTNHFLEKEDLQIDEYSAMYILSTFYFDNRWYHSFQTSSSYQDKFYIDSNHAIDANYMMHTYYGQIYEYDHYVSCYDYYENGMKIQYLVPKEQKDNIFTLVENKNFLKETGTLKDNIIIQLSALKFDVTFFQDFTQTLKKMGLVNAFDDDVPAFNYVFNENLNQNIFLSFVKQKNNISFTEDGTTIKSVTFSGLKSTSAAPYDDTYEVSLNQPFIYVIYDSNDLPLFIGNVNHP